MNDNSHEGKLARIEDRLDRSVAGAIAVSRGGSAAFRSMSDVMEFSKLMSIAQQAVPKHLRGQPGLCLGVIMQAVAWEMEPFAVAKKSYVVNDNLAYESQLIHAVIEARAPLKKRLRCTYSGEGQDRQCTVSGTFVGEDEPHEYTTPKFKDIPVKNSPLWKWDVDQQMFYLGSRAWARKWCPDVLLGVYSQDEAQYAGEDATPVQSIIHNPLQDDADLNEREDLREPAHAVVLGAAANEFITAGEVREVLYPTDKPVNHDPETGEAFDAKADSERRDAEDAPAPELVGSCPKCGKSLRGKTSHLCAATAEPAADAKPPRQTRRKAQDEPKPAEAAKATPDEKASPAPNPALAVTLEQPWAKLGPSDYIAYLWKWTEAWAKWGQDPNGLRDRYVSERDIRNNLGTGMDEKQLAEAKAIAAGVFSRLGGKTQ